MITISSQYDVVLISDLQTTHSSHTVAIGCNKISVMQCRKHADGY